MYVRTIVRGKTHGSIADIFDDQMLIEEYLHTRVHRPIYSIFHVVSLVCYVFILKQYRKKETNQCIKLCGFGFSLVENKSRVWSKRIWLLNIDLFYAEKLFKVNLKLILSFGKVLGESLFSQSYLTHFSPMFHFYTPGKLQKSKGFGYFRGL